MAAVSKIKRVDDAYQRLKDGVRTNQLAPGSVILEPELARLLGMSKTPVREALIQLPAEGLVELVARHGARIVPVLAEGVKEIYEVLTAIEPAAAAALARRSPSAIGKSDIGNGRSSGERRPGCLG